MVRNIGRGRGEEGAAGGQRAEKPELELDEEKGGPGVGVGARQRAGHVPGFPRPGSRSDRPGAQRLGPAETRVLGEPEEARGSRAARRPRGAESS